MHSANTLPPLLELDQVGDHRYSGRPEHSGERRNVVFGGQILAQMIMAAHLDRSADRPNDLEVKSIHAIFARAGDYAAPIEYEVESMHTGRTLGSDTVTFSSPTSSVTPPMCRCQRLSHPTIREAAPTVASSPARSVASSAA